MFLSSQLCFPVPALANRCQEQWVQICDRLLDEEPAAIGAAVAAVTDLVEAGLSAEASSSRGFLLQVNSCESSRPDSMEHH